MGGKSMKKAALLTAIRLWQAGEIQAEDLAVAACVACETDISSSASMEEGEFFSRLEKLREKHTLLLELPIAERTMFGVEYKGGKLVSGIPERLQVPEFLSAWDAWKRHRIAMKLFTSKESEAIQLRQFDESSASPHVIAERLLYVIGNKPNWRHHYVMEFLQNVAFDGSVFTSEEEKTAYESAIEREQRAEKLLIDTDRDDGSGGTGSGGNTRLQPPVRTNSFV